MQIYPTHAKLFTMTSCRLAALLIRLSKTTAVDGVGAGVNGYNGKRATRNTRTVMVKYTT